MGYIKKTVFTAGLGAVGYGYYLSKQYESIPYYQLPSSMRIHNIVEDYKSHDNHYFAYCNTFTSKIRLDPKLINKFSERDLLNSILINFLNSNFYRFELTSFSQRQFTLKDLTNHEPQIAKTVITGSDKKDKLDITPETREEVSPKLLEILPRKQNNSLVLRINIPSFITKSVETLAYYGLPYRVNDSTYQELFVELQPEVNEATKIIETYSAKLYFSNADLYAKNNHDGKIMPRFVLSIHRFYNRLLLQSGTNSIIKKLGAHKEEKQA